MGDWLVRLLAVGFVAWLIVFALRTRYEFMILIADGRPRLKSGTVTPAFLATVADVGHSAGVVRGWIGGVRHGRLTVLRFSRDFPPSAQQRIRNDWQLTR